MNVLGGEGDDARGPAGLRAPFHCFGYPYPGPAIGTSLNPYPGYNQDEHHYYGAHHPAVVYPGYMSAAAYNYGGFPGYSHQQPAYPHPQAASLSAAYGFPGFPHQLPANPQPNAANPTSGHPGYGAEPSADP